MRKLIAIEYLTLDGVMEHPAWSGPYFSDEVGQFQNEQLFASEALLLGRVTYQGMAAAWPTMQDEDGFADRINALPKFVITNTADVDAWNGRPLRGDAVEQVQQLREQAGGPLLIYGSGQLVRALLPHGLIDELHLLLCPVAVGKGQQLFGEGCTAQLKLMNTRPTSGGMVILSYCA